MKALEDAFVIISLAEEDLKKETQIIEIKDINKAPISLINQQLRN